jgi:glycosyltransferase involved in cell wall biosynthesis
MLRIRISIWKARIREWITFDSVLIGIPIQAVLGMLGLWLCRSGNRRTSFRLMSYVHRTSRVQSLTARIERMMQARFSPTDGKADFDSYMRQHINSSHHRAPANLVNNPEKMLKNQAIVLASAFESDARGVLLLKYNYAFPLLVSQYDFRRILEKYHIVLEPSWSGYCTEDILALSLFRPANIFVQTGEPRDERYLKALNANFTSVPIAANWWVDHRVIRVAPQTEKDLDYLLIASWADFKRHHRVFAAISSLRKKGHALKGACLGYPSGRTMEDIRARAAYYGVDDLIEFHQRVPHDVVSHYLNRAKVNVLWSRREGFNRVIIEGMFCDTPCLIPENFNYGYRYPYINEQTGRWSNDHQLENDLLEMATKPWPYSPSSWVKTHMTPQHAVVELERSIGRYCAHVGESPPTNLVAKINKLGAMHYWDPADYARFERDYDFVRRCLRTRLNETTDVPSAPGQPIAVH